MYLSTELAELLLNFFVLAKDINAVSAIVGQCLQENIVIHISSMTTALKAIQSSNDHRNYHLIIDIFNIFLADPVPVDKNKNKKLVGIAYRNYLGEAVSSSKNDSVVLCPALVEILINALCELNNIDSLLTLVTQELPRRNYLLTAPQVLTILHELKKLQLHDEAIAFFHYYTNMLESNYEICNRLFRGISNTKKLKKLRMKSKQKGLTNPIYRVESINSTDSIIQDIKHGWDIE